jgi:serine-type D-Ala-D-Ala carboxypeptidase (penicillin-binding protein 5/6)
VAMSHHAVPVMFEHGATAAFAVDLTTGVELFAHNADQPLPPASTMKVVTAIVALRVLSPDDTVVIEDEDLVDPETYSSMGLLTGDVVSVRVLLHGLLMQSGGDAALALARAAGMALDPDSISPVERFVAEMNVFAASIGMRHTHFTNPIGTDEPGLQHSSARDLVRATQVVLDDWLLTQIVGARSAMVELGGPNARVIELVTTNAFLDRADVFGVKTGTEDLAGQCLIAGFWRGDNQIITVVLGSEDRYADTQALMDIIDSQYRWAALGIGTHSTGAADAISAMGLEFMVRRTIIMTAQQFDLLDWELIEHDRGFGTHAGVVRFSIEGREVARIPVY